ncbi:MAG: glutamine-hydrolyzing GMP synthase [Bacillota bacterium]|jgi:GMP synthase (glutamine-hydrolysing)
MSQDLGRQADNQVVILDLGGAHIQHVARSVRQHKVYCRVMSGDAPVQEIRRAVDTHGQKNPGAIIILRTGSSNAPQGAAPDSEVFKMGCPVLEIPESEWDGSKSQMLGDFLFDVARLKPDWTPQTFTKQTVRDLRERVGGHSVISGVSGGVDSTVATVLVHRAVGPSLHCILVDNGLLRKNEANSVMTALSHLGIRVNLVNAEDRFLSRLKGVQDPEEKRKIIGQEFIKVFEEEARKFGDAKFFVQGTIYPDVIESGSKFRPVVKSHHNVGGLPERMNLDLLEPLKELFKDEVRAVGRELGISLELLERHPFPGPGLGVRVLGEVTRDKLDILREAQAILDEEIRAAGIYGTMWQCFCIIPGVRTVGVKDGKRTYGHLIAIRAVESEDAMTATWARIPYDVLGKVSARIVGEVPEVNRVVLDITSKPPSTIEWE